MQTNQIQQPMSDPLKLFKASFRSKFTARVYTCHLNKYANDNDNNGLLSMAKLTQREAEDKLIDFIITNKEEGMSWGALHNYVSAVTKFYLVNDITLNLHRVKRFMPEQTRLRKDRPYKSEEIQQLTQLSTERISALILLLCSSGMRVGGAAGLKYSDLEDKGDIYKITVYAGTNQEYYTFCTPEAKKALDSYFEIRKRHGETITGKCPVIREQYNRSDNLAIRYPKPSTVGGLMKAIGEVAERAGIRARIKRTRTSNASYMKDIGLSKGFRKFFNSQLAKVKVNPLIKEMLMGHHIGLDDNYFRPEEQDVQAEFEKAVDNLTIDPANRLQRKVERLEVEASQLQRLQAAVQRLEAKIK